MAQAVGTINQRFRMIGAREPLCSRGSTADCPIDHGASISNRGLTLTPETSRNTPDLS
jgi:hypothetical protein